MRLVYTETGLPVKVGDKIMDDESGLALTVDFFRPPHKPASSGKISLRDDQGHCREFYVGVIDAKWIEREDQV